MFKQNMIMKRKMNSVVFCLLILVSLQVLWCEGCLKEEKDALLALNFRLDIPLPGEDGSDCCKWNGFECSNTTGRVTKLNLHNHWFDLPHSNLNYSDFVVFKDLKSLDLSGNGIVGCAENEGLENLEVLDLSNNYLDNAASILSCLDGLSSLKSMYLSSNRFNATSSIHVFETLSSKLPNLEVLDISGNDLTNDFLPSIKGFTSLKELHLSEIQLESNLHIQGLCSMLKNLEVLDLSNNNFNDSDIAIALSGLSSLKSLNLGFCQLTPRSIFNISKLRYLEILDLAENQLSESILENDGFTWPTNLQVLRLAANGFNKKIISSLRGLGRLKSLDISDNQLDGSVEISGLLALTSLDILDLSDNQINGFVVHPENDGFTRPTNLQVLRLSSNSFTNKSLSSLSGFGCLKSLDLSQNQLDGSVDISGLFALSSLEILDLSYNQINSFFVHRVSGSKNLSKLDVLALDYNNINGSKLKDSLQAFSFIRALSMSWNEIIGEVIAGDFRDLSNLEHLVLDYNFNLQNEFFNGIEKLTSLKIFSLAACGINGTLPPADWSKLKKLEELDLSFNEFEGLLPSSFINMTSLRRLELSYNHFIGNFDSNVASLTSLEYFGFIENQFEGPISFTPFANHSKLKFIYGEGNKVIRDTQHSLQTWIPKFQLQVLSLSSITKTDSVPLPSFLLYQNNLSSLDFTSCRLEGEFPNWLLENNTKMTELLFRNCSFTGTFQLPLHPLPNMRRIDVSDNNITGQIPSNNISSILPHLRFLNLSRNHIKGSISREFGQMNFLDTLDLSDNHLSGKIPKNIAGNWSQLTILKLSNNNLDGPLFATLNHLEALYLDGNSLYGIIPFDLCDSYLKRLDVSNNHLAGKLPCVTAKWSNLIILSLSNNHLEGSIPKSLLELRRLTYLDISHNNLTGYVPSFDNSLLRYIHLSNNRLSGWSKSMFNSSEIMILDLSYNEINNSIQDLIQDLTRAHIVYILVVKGNHFTGHLPKQLCELVYLSILDLSHNKISGAIPDCLSEVPFAYSDGLKAVFKANFPTRPVFPRAGVRNEHEKVSFTTKRSSYTYTGDILKYMSGIDLSCNKLNGSIPSELGNLTKIRALNLSHNELIGQIPATFSNLLQTESLDLSFNKLSGRIPLQLNSLTSLEVFSVAHNNLSGETPERKGQFITFDESSYEGNPLLCGPPLQKSCNPYGQPHSISPNSSYIDEDNGDLVDMFVFGVSFSVSYTLVLLVIAVTLYINPYWRQAWFYCIELVTTNCYYFIEDNLRRFSNFINM